MALKKYRVYYTIYPIYLERFGDGNYIKLASVIVFVKAAGIEYDPYKIIFRNILIIVANFILDQHFIYAITEYEISTLFYLLYLLPVLFLVLKNNQDYKYLKYTSFNI